MRNRCTNKKSPSFNNYGGRGIRICRRWQKFENFFADVGKAPTLKHTIDRINNNRGYYPGNVRWATPLEQGRNTRRSRFVIIAGLKKTLSEWEELSGTNAYVASRRIAVGIDPEVAFFATFIKRNPYANA